MQIGMLGIGRMGANMALRLMRRGHTCVVFDQNAAAVEELVKQGAVGSRSIQDLVGKLSSPRITWMMLPAAVVDTVLAELKPCLEAGDIIVDGGNSYYHDDIWRAKELGALKINYVDVGVSGGVWGLERGYCQMIGGEPAVVKSLDPLFAALSPGVAAAPRTPGREQAEGTAEKGYLHCGPSGAGHFVKMVHNGIEYGIMEAYAEGMNILRHANAGTRPSASDAETTPLQHPEFYSYDINLTDVAEVWRRGSVIGSWLLDLTAEALLRDPRLSQFRGRVSDSGEGRWTVQAALDEAVPAPVISAALYARFSSRGDNEFADKLMSAIRHQFGGHVEKRADN